MSITYIVPCLNVEQDIIKNYKKLCLFIKKKKINSNIIFINDGSKDLTIDKLKSIKDQKVKIIDNKKNLGKSQSIINTIKKVKTKNIVLIDCDLPYFEYLDEVINNLKNNDLVIINRKIKNSKNLDKKKNFYQIIRLGVSNLFGYLTESILNLKVMGDTQAGLKAFKLNKEIKRKKFISKYYFFDIELINFFRKQNSKIKLIPVKFKVSNNSSIKIFSFKNFNYINELIKVLYKS